MSDLSLTQKQIDMLQAIFDTDQEIEQYWRWRASIGDYPPAASVWRWMPYALYSGLRSRIKTRRLDRGAKRVWRQLADLGLIETRIAEGVAEVKITPKGRKLIRTLTGVQAPKRLPTGVLKPRQWSALVELWKAFPKGVGDLDYRYDYMATLRRLLIYKPTPLALDRGVGNLIITEAGREFYRKHWQLYRERYPEVDAPAPD